jgi:hypothetical protein
MLLYFLMLVQAAQPEAKLAVAEQKPTMTGDEALAALTQVKLSIEWNDKERTYSCKVKEASGIAWLDVIPCAALKKCEKGRGQKPEELMPCFQEKAAALVEEAIQQ